MENLPSIYNYQSLGKERAEKVFVDYCGKTDTKTACSCGRRYFMVNVNGRSKVIIFCKHHFNDLVRNKWYCQDFDPNAFYFDDEKNKFPPVKCEAITSIIDEYVNKIFGGWFDKKAKNTNAYVSAQLYDRIYHWCYRERYNPHNETANKILGRTICVRLIERPYTNAYIPLGVMLQDIMNGADLPSSIETLIVRTLLNDVPNTLLRKCGFKISSIKERAYALSEGRMSNDVKRLFFIEIATMLLSTKIKQTKQI